MKITSGSLVHSKHNGTILFPYSFMSKLFLDVTLDKASITTNRLEANR
jgi:hypothetical protein